MRYVFSLFFGLIITVSGYAMFPVIDVGNIAQAIQSNLKLVQQLDNQARQIKHQLAYIHNQAKNLAKVPDYQWRDISKLITNLDSVSRQSNALSYQAKNLDASFRRKYPGYDRGPLGKLSYAKQYKDLNTSTLNSVKNSVKAAGIATKDYRSEHEYLEALKQHGEHAEGRMQVLQASTEIAAENVHQLQSMKHLMASQANAQNAYMAYQVQKDADADAVMAKVIAKLPEARDVPYKNDPRFGKIRWGSH